MVLAMKQAAESVPEFDWREDRWVRNLESQAAELLGKEDSLFCPSCTLCNQIAINIFCRPGESLVCETQSHIVTSERGAPAAISGVTSMFTHGKNGLVSANGIVDTLNHASMSCDAPVSLLVIENTHTRSGGRVLSRELFAEIRKIADSAGIAIHLDGARLFNAAVHLRTDVANLAKHADSVALSLNKGLAAPLGAILAGTSEFIEQAVVIRQRLGGGWRPAAIPAAAGSIALTEMVERIAEDHERAAKLAAAVKGIRGLEIKNDPVETNLVLVQFPGCTEPPNTALRYLSEKGIHALAFGSTVRFALHNGVEDDGVDFAVEALSEFATRFAA